MAGKKMGEGPKNKKKALKPRPEEGIPAVPDGQEGDGATASIAVADTGIGIDPKDHARVFEDFQQVDTSTTRQYMGTGLGLSICRRLAEMLGGKITLESAIGKGSTFTLHVPRRTRPRPRR